MDAIVFFMQVISVLIVAAGGYLCLVHAGILPEARPRAGFAVAAGCVLFGAALWAFALTLTIQPAPVEAAELEEPAEPFAPSALFAFPPPALSVHGDGRFEAYEYH
jgi:hypothetical protein